MDLQIDNSSFLPGGIRSSVYNMSALVGVPEPSHSPKPEFLWDIHGSQAYFQLIITNSTLTDTCVGRLARISRILYTYGIAVLVAVAVLMNGVLGFVFLSRILRQHASSIYLTALALVDLFTLCLFVPKGWLRLLMETLDWGDFHFHYDYNQAVCKIVTFSANFFMFMSAWCLIAAAYSRMSAMKDSLHLKEQQTPRAARIIILYVACIGVLVNGHVFFTWSVSDVDNTAGSQCRPAVNSTDVAMFLTLGTLTADIGLPTLATGILTGYLAKALHNQRHMLRRRLSPKLLTRLQERRAMTRMILALCALSTVLGTPRAITWIVVILQHFSSTSLACPYVYSLAARDITEILFLLNYCCKLLICMLTGMSVMSPKSTQTS